jgi:ATP-binding cassette subfamily F protein uup
VVGKNGVGKSTFLDLLTGSSKPDTGEIIPGVTTKIGYFTQEVEDLNPNHRVIEEVKEIAEFITLADGSQVSASKFLDIFLFPPEKQYNVVEKLSGGEKKRLQLLKVLVKNPNFLVLDEPTNDFDIDTLNVLEDFLDKFNGCLVLVSHDRYFMDHLVEQLFVFEGEGKISVFNGNYSDYRIWVEEEEASKLKHVIDKPVKEESKSEKKKLSFKEKQEFDQLQPEIQQLEKRKENLTTEMNNGTADHAQLLKLSEEIKQVTETIDEKTLRWLELSELIG